MRSIGKKATKILNQVMNEVIKGIDRQQFGWVTEFEKAVIERLPSGMWDTWEGADSEIRNLIDEFAQDYDSIEIRR